MPALLSDSGRPASPGPTASRCCLRTSGQPRRRQVLISELNHTADILAPPRLVTPVTRPPRGARYRLVANLAGRDLHPLGSNERFRKITHTQVISSPSPRLSLAHPDPDPERTIGYGYGYGYGKSRLEAPGTMSLVRMSHRVSSRGRRGAVLSGVFDPRGAEAYLTVRRAPRGEKAPLSAVHRRPQ
jgi:hypothetical protein